MHGLVQSLRYTIRLLLLKSPGFTVTAVLILGFGIGVNTAIFSLIDAVLLNPLPFPKADRLVQIFQLRTGDGYPVPIDYPDYQDLRRDQRSFENLSVSFYDYLDLSGSGNPERLTAILASPDLFRVTNLPFLLGRPFTEEEDKSGGPLMVVLSESLWRGRFNSDPHIVGKNLTLSGESFEVIGICPRQVEDVGTPPKDLLYVPAHVLESFGSTGIRRRDEHFLSCFGRLKEGITLAQAQADLETIQNNLVVRYPDTDKGHGIRVTRLLDSTIASYAATIWLLGAGVGCLLLISSANVANLLFVRALDRREEMMIRATLGASRSRLVSQLLLEAAVLSLFGGALGSLIACWVIALIKVLSPQHLFRFQEINLNATALLFIVGVTALVSLLSGLLPACSLSRASLGFALKDESGRAGTAGPRRQRTQSLLVSGQVALACVLLIGAGLLVRSFQAAQSLPLGFNPHQLLTIKIYPTSNQYADLPHLKQFFDTVLDKARRLPGIVDAAMWVRKR
jgi:putative ABC transport system permease protein